MILRAAIQSSRENASDGGLADAAMSAEDIAVGGASLLDGILQGARDVLLSDDLGKFLRTVLARQDGVTHEEKLIIRDRFEHSALVSTFDPGEPYRRGR